MQLVAISGMPFSAVGQVRPLLSITSLRSEVIGVKTMSSLSNFIFKAPAVLWKF